MAVRKILLLGNPDLLVKLSNPRRCRLNYRDEHWQEHIVELEDDYAQLLQHEVDHLDGVLAVQRAIDGQSFALRQTMPDKNPQLSGYFLSVLRVWHTARDPESLSIVE